MLYEYLCECGAEHVEWCSVSLRDVERWCVECGGVLRRVLCVPNLDVSCCREVGGAAHRAWLETPTVQAKLRSGEYELSSAKEPPYPHGL